MWEINNFYRLILTIKLVLPYRKPAACFVLVKSYIKSKLMQKPVLRGVDIVTNYSCNLSCKHCNIYTMKKDKGKELTISDYKDIERQCSKLGVFQYCFTGGEPLLRKDFESLVKLFKPFKRVIFVQTNGKLIDSISKAVWLKKIGVDTVNVSLDSGIEDEHDRNRGLADHYKQTINAIKFCKIAGLKTIIGTVISHKNLYSEGVKILIDFVTKEKIMLIMNLAAPIGKWYKNDEILLTIEDQSYIREMARRNPYIRLDMDSTMKKYGCPAFKEKLYITPYGDVTGCTFAQISFGNIKQKSISSIREEALKINLMNEYSTVCYAAEDMGFIKKYMSKLGENVPKYYKDLINSENEEA